MAQHIKSCPRECLFTMTTAQYKILWRRVSQIQEQSGRKRTETTLRSWRKFPSHLEILLAPDYDVNATGGIATIRKEITLCGGK